MKNNLPVSLLLASLLACTAARAADDRDDPRYRWNLADLCLEESR